MRILLVILFLLGCDSLYKAGNLKELGYPIQTTLQTKTIRKYIDTVIKSYYVPDKWKEYDKLISLDSINNKRIYFKSNPEEMYLISFQGVVVLVDVFNPQIKKNGWVADTNLVSKNEKKRILKRFESEILARIESIAKRSNLPDTLIYDY